MPTSFVCEIVMIQLMSCVYASETNWLWQKVFLALKALFSAEPVLVDTISFNVANILFMYGITYTGTALPN